MFTITISVPGVVVSAVVSAIVGALLKTTLDWLIQHRHASPEKGQKRRTHSKSMEQR